jgi:hypothetical protein
MNDAVWWIGFSIGILVGAVNIYIIIRDRKQ